MICDPACGTSGFLVAAEYPPASEIFAELRELEVEVCKGLEELEAMV